jgi:hypothetical protein
MSLLDEREKQAAPLVSREGKANGCGWLIAISAMIAFVIGMTEFGSTGDDMPVLLLSANGLAIVAALSFRLRNHRRTQVAVLDMQPENGDVRTRIRRNTSRILRRQGAVHAASAVLLAAHYAVAGLPDQAHADTLWRFYFAVFGLPLAAGWCFWRGAAHDHSDGA